MSLRFPATLLAFMAILWLKAINPTSSGYTDPDFFWHLTYGLWMVDHQTVPAGDFFSWSMPGEPYQITQWLGEAALGLAYSFAGLAGTKMLSVALTGITIGFAWKAAERYIHTSAALCIALVCNWLQLITPMRPQLFSFALLSVATYLVVSWLSTRRSRYLLIYPFVIALWVNLHGGFVVGLLLIGLVATCQTAESFLNKTIKSDALELAKAWATVLAAALATLVNPYGYKAVMSVLMISGLHSSSVIIEWQPVNLTTGLGWAYLSCLIPFFAALLLTSGKPKLSHVVIAGVFLVFGVMANRQVPLCGAVMAPFIAALLANTPQYHKMLPTISNPSRPVIHLLCAAALALSFPTIAEMGDSKTEQGMKKLYPVDAVDFINQNNLSDRVMSDIVESNYMIHRGLPVFIDSRLDFYMDQFFFEWYLALRSANGWDALLEKHHPKALLLKVDVSLRQTALASGKWKQVFEDNRYSVLVPSSSKLPEVPAREFTYLDGKGGMARPYTP